VRERAWAAGIAGPAGFLVLMFAAAAARSDLIRGQGWVGWPSSMSLGGPPAALVGIAAFLWLALCDVVFAIGSLRPAFGWGAAALGYLAVAAGDVLLAFPTDAPEVDLTWHGGLHLAGVLVVTVATLVAVIGVTAATRGDAGWRPWRLVAWVPFAAALVGLLDGFEHGWAKVTYVVGITLPGAMAGWLMARRSAEATSDVT
jgi:hypothetical protein